MQERGGRLIQRFSSPSIISKRKLYNYANLRKWTKCKKRDRKKTPWWLAFCFICISITSLYPPSLTPFPHWQGPVTCDTAALHRFVKTFRLVKLHAKELFFKYIICRKSKTFSEKWNATQIDEQVCFWLITLLSTYLSLKFKILLLKHILKIHKYMHLPLKHFFLWYLTFDVTISHTLLYYTIFQEDFIRFLAIFGSIQNETTKGLCLNAVICYDH